MGEGKRKNFGVLGHYFIKNQLLPLTKFFPLTLTLTLTLTLMLPLQAFAWNSVGHRIIAQIAYDQLTVQAKKQVDALTAVAFHSSYPDTRFLQAATWPDKIKARTGAYKQEHFVNLPINQSINSEQVLEQDNVVVAIERNEAILKNPSASPRKKSYALAFLAHFVGDIEQPLHCASLVNAQFPKGDAGGNDYKIRSPIADNLHQLWDEGLGLFVSQERYQFHYWQIQQIALQWQQAYPKQDFSKQLTQSSVLAWAHESNALAKQTAYTLPEYAQPSNHYLSEGREIVKQQIVLAGYRLAAILNSIYG